MKVLSIAVLLSGLCLSGLAQASQVPNEVLNTFQLVRSYTSRFQTTGVSANGGKCVLNVDYQPAAVVVTLTGDEDAFKEAASYLTVFTKVETYTGKTMTFGDYGWDGEETQFTLESSGNELTVSAEYHFSEHFGGGFVSDVCVFKKK
ncbi:hypothetical protein [Bdellovibrio sp. GT3]|uniref:hypothetical protein n=1 Tax=unclassified Bdellovibrio TaxID=2633795 RepID=UPI0030F3221E